MTSALPYYWKPLLGAVGLAGVLFHAPAWAQSGVATAAAEATIYENPATQNAGSYDTICVGNLDGFVITRRAFVRFDLPAIPPGAVVTRVVYQFNQVRVRHMGVGAPKTATLELRRVTETWEEGAGMRLIAPCGGGDEVPGVTWATAPAVQAGTSATVPLSSSGGTFSIDTDSGTANDGLIADVQAWVNNPAGNFGWEYRLADEDELDNTRLLEPGSFTVYWIIPLEFGDGFESP